MAACCNSSTTSSSSSLSDAAAAGGEDPRSREEALQLRLDQMRRERQSELKSIGRLVADTAAAEAAATGGVDARHAAVRRLLPGGQQEQQASASGPTTSATTDHTTADSSSNSGTTTAGSSSAILVEVRGLSELRPVSRILQSSAFRTELESLVRYSLSPRQQRPQQQQQQSQQQPQQLPQQQPQQQSQQQPQPQDSQEDQRSLTELRRQRHADLVEEISELLHSQLVSGGLDGAFRGRLERELRDRAEALPDGGRRAVAALRSLPPSGVLRNNFSHLGIWPPADADFGAANSSSASNDDVLSVMSVPISAAAATTAAVVANNGAVSRQLHSVQRELTELRRTVRLLLGNQLETQRMIRQEVSAALAGRSPAAAAASASAAPAPAAAASAPPGACLICLTSRADTVMYRCGHLCLCHLCTARMRDSAPDGRLACPVCRAPVVDTMRVFPAGVADASADDN